jgi:hypothetical protein
MGNSTYINPNSSANVSILTSYASGIETMRQAMSMSVDTSILESYASGTNILARKIETYASGIETLREAMVITGGDTTQVTAYASGTRTLQITIQDNVTGLTTYTSGVQEQLSDFQIAQTSVNTAINTYTSGVQEQLADFQIAQTSVNTEINSYTSGTRTLEITIQNNQTSINNTLSGVITDVREIESYASGNKTLLLNHANQHREGSTDELSAVPFNGFVNRTDSNLILSGYALQITPNTEFTIYSNGNKFIKNTTQQVLITAQGKEHYVYFDTAGNPQVANTIWDIKSDNVPAAIVYRNNLKFAIVDERHGYKRDRQWHQWAHDTVGCRYQDGLAGTFANSTFSIDSGSIHDEDLDLSIPARTACRLWTRDGAAAMTFVSGSTTTPYSTTGTLQWDNGGTLATVGVSKFVCNYIYATNDIHYPIYIMVGQTEHATIANARNDNLPAIPSLATMEWKLLYRVIYKNVGGTPTYQEATDFRQVSSGPASSYTPASHTALTNRDATDSHPVTAITGLDAYLSGTKVLNVLNQDSNTLVTAYASGIETTVINNQARITSIEITSGIREINYGIGADRPSAALASVPQGSVYFITNSNAVDIKSGNGWRPFAEYPL